MKVDSLISKITGGRIHKDGEYGGPCGSYSKIGGYYVHEHIANLPHYIILSPIYLLSDVFKIKYFRNLLGRMQGTSGCLRCGDNWRWKKHHTLQINDSTGIFPCCEECWNEMNETAKFYYCIILVKSWQITNNEEIEVLANARKAIKLEMIESGY